MITYSSPRYASLRRRVQRFINLTWALVSRDIRARYRRSILGPLWAIIPPFAQMVVFTALRGVLDVPTEGINPVVFTYTVIVPWSYFSSLVSRAGPSILGNASVMKKIRVERELFLLVAVLTSLFDALMSAIVLTGMLIFFQTPLSWAILWIPVLVALLTALGVGLGMAFSSLGIYRRDFLTVAGFSLQLLLYASPIIYPISEVPERFQTIYKLNPLVGILEGFRTVLGRGQPPDLELLAMSLPGIIIILVIGWPLFRYMSRYFTDVL